MKIIHHQHSQTFGPYRTSHDVKPGDALDILDNNGHVIYTLTFTENDVHGGPAEEMYRPIP